MEQRTIRLNFDLSFVYGPRTWRVPFVAMMLLCAVGDLNSESVTLSTYYPAPSGVYTNMITTGNTFLARDGGAATKVGIGTITPGAKVAVSGSMSVGAAYSATVPPADSMIISGKLGVGMTNPLEALDVVGSVHINAAGCSAPTPVTSGAICGAGQYAAFQAGLYIEGWSYQNHPSPYLITPSLNRIYQAVGINPIGGQQSAMSMGVVETAMVTCCPK